MDISKWKSCAVDIDTYCILRAMGNHGFRKPASMIAKITDDEIKKIAKAKCLVRENERKFTVPRAQAFER